MGQSHLIERDREMDALARVVASIAAGRGACALVEGPAGIGKSRLLAAARSRVGDMRVLGARCSELERDFPFGVVRQLFESALARPADGERLLAGAAAPAVALMDGPGTGADGDTSFAMLHGLFWLTLNLAEERPLLVAVDDLHWCDRASLRFLAYLVRRLEDLPVGVLATLRTSQPGTDALLVSEIAQDPLTTVVRPGALSAAAVSAIVSERLGAPADEVFAEACHTATGGNPLLLRQMLTALEADAVEPTAANASAIAEIGPRAVSRTVLPRVARQRPGTVEVARALAVLGDGASPSSVSALAGVDDAGLEAATRDLARADVLEADPPLRFVHPLVREAIYRDLAPAERAGAHGRAADVLRRAGAPTDRVAAQLLLAPERGRPWVAHLLLDAGRAAVRRGAPESAATYMRRALAEPPPADERPRLLLELGRVEQLTAGTSAADRLAEAWEAAPDPSTRVVAASELSRLLMLLGRGQTAAEVARRTAADLPAGMDDARLAMLACESTAYFFEGGGTERLARLRSYRRPPPPDAGVGRLMVTAIATWEMASTDGTADEAAELARAVLADGRLLSTDGAILGIVQALVLLWADRDEAMETYDTLRDTAHRTGSLLLMSTVHLWRGYALSRRGALQEAERDLRSALEHFGQWRERSVATGHAAAFLAQVLTESGRVEEARATLRRVAAPAPVTNTAGHLLEARALIALAEGQSAEALAAADALGAHCARLPDIARLRWRGYRAQALDLLGRRDEARSVAQEELAEARAWGGRGAAGRALRVLGALEREEGIGHLQEAAELLASTPSRLEHTKALAALGGALRRARRPADAREHLRAALAGARACGADGLADQVRAELQAAGARPRGDAVEGVAALTPSERRVADMAAAGDTNKSIAQALYVTPKTIEVHLGNCYRKLGIRSRRDLPRVLAGVAAATP